MQYSVFIEGVDITNFVVGASDITLLDMSYENALTVPSYSLTVISNSVTYYEAGARVVIKGDGVRISEAIIDRTDYDFAANTTTIYLVDAISLLKGYYMRDLVDDDYLAGFTASEDNNGSVNMRYSTLVSTSPHRSQFVTLTHFLKMCAVKIGIAAAASYCDATDLYGYKKSGFVYCDGYDNPVDVTLEELAYHPQQIIWAKLVNSGDPLYEGATMLDVFLYTLQVLRSTYRYDDEKIVFKRKLLGLQSYYPAMKYQLKVEGIMTEFDAYKTSVTYIPTNNLQGFTHYVNENLNPAGVIMDEESIYPDVIVVNHKVIMRDIGIMRHAIVHRRKYINPSYAMEELHFNAYNATNPSEYLFSYQFSKLLYSRRPHTLVKTILVTDDTELQPIWLYLDKASIDMQNRTFMVEITDGIS